MPTKRKTSLTKSNSLPISKWLFWAPLKFTGLFSVFIMLFVFITNIFFRNQVTNLGTLILGTLGLGFLAFSIYKIIKWTPDNHLGHKSFIMLNIAQSLISLVLLAVIGFIAIWMQTGTLELNFVMALGTLAILLMIFLAGIGLLKMKSLFCRARMQGVPKWKLWISAPFGLGMMWYSGFLISDGDKKSQDLPTKIKPLEKLANWIVKNQRNTIIAFLVFIASAGVLLLSDFKILIVFYAVSLVLGGTLLVYKKLSQNLGGLFATAVALLNIAVVFAIIWAFAGNTKPSLNMGEQIQITDVEK